MQHLAAKPSCPADALKGRMWEVVVVGAGPAGSYAAMRCAERGLRVLMLDAARFPRDKACGGIVGERAMRIPGPGVRSVLEGEGHVNQLYYDWKPVGAVDTHLYFFRRRRFDHYLVQRALAAGAELLENQRVTKVGVLPDRGVVQAGAKSHEAQLVIGADGTNSVVGRAIGMSHHDEYSKYASMKAEIDLPREKVEALGVLDPPHQNTYFFTDLLGFGWIVPNDGSVNVGYGALMRHAHGLRPRFLKFLRRMDLPPQDVRGAQIPYLPPRRVYADRVLLTGDAGGVVNPWNGCGIDDGLGGSERAAEVAKLAADRGDFTAKTLVEYQRASRDHLRWIRARGLWIKGFDRILPRGMPFPFWVKYIVKVAAP